jgi:iron complex outermembrane receptor protein
MGWDHASRVTRRAPPIIDMQAALIAAAAVCLLTSQPADAEEAEAAQSVVVIGSVSERAAFDAPFSVGVVGAPELRNAGPMINLSESMARVPGLVVNNRNNYAQDLQISSRGFGARATFGVRGLRLYTDGIPATMPDGQGQVTHFDLADAQRIEVLRGPFSVLYGNSSGGVISLVTAPARSARAEVEVDAGSFDLYQLRFSAGTPLAEGVALQVSGSAMQIEGFRPHSEAQRTLGNARLDWQRDNDRVVVLLNDVNQPAQDPLGLTRQQFDADPEQTTPEAAQFDTRKTARQTQIGSRWQHRFEGDGPLRESALMFYGGTRAVTQWQAIPPAAQASPRSSGGVVDFDRDYSGGDARLRFDFGTLQLVTGASVETQRDDRRGYENFIGKPPDQQLGVTGALRRNERDSARTDELYAQLEAAFTEALGATAGVRGGRVTLATRDEFLSNGDDSGELRFHYTNPVLGLRWKPSSSWLLYASAARGFESPTLTELAYRPDGQPGFNTALKPQTSTQAEAGAKWRSEGLQADAVAFVADTRDEIGVLTNTSGRATYQNVGRTRRSGVELSLGWQLRADLHTQFTLATLDARYRDDFLTCTATPCPAANVPVPAGNRIAGTQPASVYAELAWKPFGTGEGAVEVRGLGPTAVNDVNSDFAGGYGVLNLRYSQRWRVGSGTVECLARLDNLFDRRYAGSVIVNDTNGRFFETAAPRAVLVGLRWSAGS